MTHLGKVAFVSAVFMAGGLLVAPASAKLAGSTLSPHSEDGANPIKVSQTFSDSVITAIRDERISLPSVAMEERVYADDISNNIQFDCACAGGNIATYTAGAIGGTLGTMGGGPVAGALLGGTLYSGAEIAHQGAHGEGVFGGPLKGKGKGKAQNGNHEPKN